MTSLPNGLSCDSTSFFSYFQKFKSLQILFSSQYIQINLVPDRHLEFTLDIKHVCAPLLLKYTIHYPVALCDEEGAAAGAKDSIELLYQRRVELMEYRT